MTGVQTCALPICFNKAVDAFLDDLGRKPMEIRLERVARVAIFGKDPRIPPEMMKVITEQTGNQSSDFFVSEMKQVTGIIEGEPVDLLGAGHSPYPFFLFKKVTVHVAFPAQVVHGT